MLYLSKTYQLLNVLPVVIVVSGILLEVFNVEPFGAAAVEALVDRGAGEPEIIFRGWF